jgi:intracellular sulfur oxidation DsrE/DsrF family protein
MLDYLRDTFPTQVVLPNMPLKDLLSVRRSSNHQRAKERLQNQRVDFVVCGEDGRPVFAFDVEQYHLSNAKAKAHQVKLKNRILKTAGVRFLFLKNSIHRMPAPNDFRRQLDLAALPRPKQQEAEQGESMRQQLESKMSEYDTLVYPNTGFRESEVMGLSGLMGLGEAKADRKSERDRQIENVRRRA